MIDIKDKVECCGCSACASSCPVDAIAMQQDAEGFLYPMVDMKRCVECGRCEKVCPIRQVKTEIPRYQQAWLAQSLDKGEQMASTSGGIGAVLARVIVERGGVVFGARFDENLDVCHAAAETVEESKAFRGSKYVQSDVMGCYRQVRALLREGREVLFTGTPCQVEGLSSFLDEQYDTLYCCDVVCHAVPSPLIWHKYLEFISKHLSSVVDGVFFRDKRLYGYKYSQMFLTSSQGNVIYHNGVESDPMLRAFFSNICDRPSCYDCHFKKRYRESDLTIWDCFDVGLREKAFDDDRGTTNILVQSEKGARLLEMAKKYLRIKEQPANQAVAKAYEMTHSVSGNSRRGAFLADAAYMDGTELFENWFPETVKVRIKCLLRRGLVKLGVYRNIKKIIWRFK